MVLKVYWADSSPLLQEKERDHFSQFVTESFTAYCKRKRRDKVGNFATKGQKLEVTDKIHMCLCCLWSTIRVWESHCAILVVSYGWWLYKFLLVKTLTTSILNCVQSIYMVWADSSLYYLHIYWVLQLFSFVWLSYILYSLFPLALSDDLLELISWCNFLQRFMGTTWRFKQWRRCTIGPSTSTLTAQVFPCAPCVCP